MKGEFVAYLQGGNALMIPDGFFQRRLVGDVSLVYLEENDDVCDAVENGPRRR